MCSICVCKTIGTHLCLPRSVTILHAQLMALFDTAHFLPYVVSYKMVIIRWWIIMALLGGDVGGVFWETSGFILWSFF